MRTAAVQTSTRPPRRPATARALAVTAAGAVMAAFLAVPAHAASSPASSPASSTSSSTEPAGQTGQTGPACATWTSRVVASGLGTAENLVPDGQGGLLVSTNDSTGKLLRLSPDGAVTPLATDLPYAGGLARDGQWVYVATGASALSGLLGTADGTIVRLRVDGGDRTTVATGLVAPNGLARLPDGALVATRTIDLGLGISSAVTHVSPQGVVTPRWSALDGTNGIALDPSGEWLYVNRSLAGETWRVDVANPAHAVRVAAHPLLAFPDDLTVAADGLITTRYLAGEVVRIDPATGMTCVLARGLAQASSVRAGDGRGFRADRLYVTSHAGNVYELAPPAG
ncbi:SMP-30/gluconolactonase/LRE family protein [Frankia sp. CcI49]|uniref:SMP-30/gluconolactonase/LRE family protein n=1 Tax=Frankia sp. CcI49 TaxID=1745382 RepID=UPI00105632AF|nr:SMP-30/gluconolactonase/LRE family protein [Frankia sp. CcI49]